jgi:hypothetical protein
MNKFLHNVVEFFKGLRRPAERSYEIVWDLESVDVSWTNSRHEAGSVSFSWSDVSAVNTYKWDLWGFDCICLAFETPDGCIEVGEDMKGWDKFLDAVESALPGFPGQEKWWKKVAYPPFEENLARLWTRKCYE